MKVSTVLSIAAMAVAGVQADSSFSAEDQAIWIDRHNYFRSTGLPWSAGNMRRIGWDASLATTAATTASGCSATTAAGLNVYTSSLNSTSILDEAIQSWVVDTSLSTLASLSQPSTGDAVGTGVYNSYSQVVWAATYSVGCATATCSSGEMVVCAYSPAGNDGSSGWYVHADQASQCPEGTAASDGLCIVDGDAANNAIAAVPAGKSTAEVYPTYVSDVQAAIVGGGATGSASGSSTASIAGSISSSAAGSAAESITGSTGESAATTTPSTTPSTASSTSGSTTTTAPSTTIPTPSATTATPSTTTAAPSSTTKAPTSSMTKSTTAKPSTKSASNLSSSSSSKETSTTKKTSKTTTSSSSDSTTNKADSSSPGTVKASSASGSSFENQASSSETTTSESSTTTTAPSTGSTTAAGSTTGVSANNESSSNPHGMSTLSMVSVIVVGVVAVAGVSMFVNYRLSQQRQRDIMLDGGI